MLSSRPDRFLAWNRLLLVGLFVFVLSGLTVVVSAAASFQIAITPSSVEVSPGGSAAIGVTVTSIDGFRGKVALSCEGLPAGVSCSFAPSAITVPKNATAQSALTIKTTTSAQPGAYQIRVNAKRNGRTSSATLNLTVSAPSFTLSLSPDALSLNQGRAGATTVIINRSNDFTGSVTLIAEGLPAGASASFSPNPASNTSQMSVTVGAATPLGVYQVTVRGTSGSVARATSLSLTVFAGTSGAPVISGCQIFPPDNPWNQDISQLPVHPNSANYIASIGLSATLHPDFGGGGVYGIPFVVVPQGQTRVPINFTDYGDESDPGPYPVPPDAPVEGGNDSNGDRHVIVLEAGECKLFELYRAFYRGPGWDAASGAIFDLNSNALRPDYWTSADAAGLAILPGLVRYDEVAAGAIKHAVRFTVSRTQRGFIHPATHFASSSTDPNLPPMGLRVRLKASYDISRFNGQARVILEALKKYGMMVADNGSNWYITGAADPRWDDTDLRQLKSVPGSAFEAVYTGEIIR